MRLASGRRFTPLGGWVRETRPFLEFFLCLSRACLGKMIVLMYKWLKRTFLAHVCTNNDPFTKIGSGQTDEKLRKRRRFLQTIIRPMTTCRQGCSWISQTYPPSFLGRPRGAPRGPSCGASPRTHSTRANAMAQRRSVRLWHNANLHIKTIILPRQARDKHRENSKERPFSYRCVRECDGRGGARGGN
jgi:hypothetical protein